MRVLSGPGRAIRQGKRRCNPADTAPRAAVSENRLYVTYVLAGGRGCCFPWRDAGPRRLPTRAAAMNSIRTIPSRLATSASEHPGQGFLFPHRLHRSDTLDVADRSAIPECQQSDQGTPDQFRRFSLSFFGPKAPPGKENNWVQTIPGKG